jgi:alcohol dehydrogenase
VWESLETANLAVGVFDRVTPNPAAADIEVGSAGLHEFEPADLSNTVVVAVGGGSSLDAAKGIALHAANPGPAEDLDFRAEQERPGLPVVAVPTTAGTGSETNHFGVITDTVKEKKFYVGHPSVKPRAAVLDPLLTVGLPPAATAATGIDALVHALEALMSRGANPYADGLALQAVRMVNEWLPRTVSDGADVEARSQMLMAAHLAGRAFSSGTGLGLCHALAHAISAHTGAAHGVALAVVLPRVLEFNVPVSVRRLSPVAGALGVARPNGSYEQNSWQAVAAVEYLARTVVAEQTLSDLGVTEDRIPALVRDTLADAVLGNTPRPPSAEEARRLLVSLL